MDLFRRLTAGALFCLCIAACSHMNPYETPWQERPDRADNRRILAPSAIAAPDYRDTRYVSTMHEELERVDEHRMRLQGIIGKIGSERDFYDAALWLTVPLVAFSPAPKDVTRGAAVLGAGYAWLNARPKEQVPILEHAVGALTCLMVAYSPYLYTNRDFGELVPERLHSRRYDDLLLAIQEFEARSQTFVASVPLLASVAGPVSCASEPSPECAERRRRRATTTPGNQGQIERYRDQVAQRAQAASDDAAALAALEDRILRAAPFELAARAHLIIARAGERERAAQPPPIAFGALVKVPPAQAGAGGGTATAQSGERTPRLGTGLPALRAPDAASRALRDDADAAARRLADARRAAQAFMAAHGERLAAAKGVAQDYCTRYATPAEAVANAAAAPAAAPGAGTDRAVIVPLER